MFSSEKIKHVKEVSLSEIVLSMGEVGLPHNVNTETGVHSLSIVVGQKAEAVGSDAERIGLLESRYM